MKSHAYWFGLVLATAAVMAAVPGAPSAGVVRRPDGTLRPVLGFSGNLIQGQPLPASGVTAASFGADAGLVLTADGALKLLTTAGAELAVYPSAEQHPVLSAADDVSSGAAAWLPESRSVVRWTKDAGFRTDSFEASELGDAEVLDLRVVQGGALEFLLHRQQDLLERVLIAPGSATLIHRMQRPIASRVAVMADEAIVFSKDGGIQLEWPDNRTESFHFTTTDIRFEHAAPHWLHISSAATGRDWMLHLDRTKSELSALPPAESRAAVQAEASR